MWVDITVALVDDATCDGSPDQIAFVDNYQIAASGPHEAAITVSASTIYASDPKRIKISFVWDSTNKPGTSMTIDYNNTHAAAADSNLQPSTLTIPEKTVFLVAAAPLIPVIVMWMRKRRLALVGNTRKCGWRDRI